MPIFTRTRAASCGSSTTTQIYTRITNEKIGRDMDALEAKIGDKFRIAQ